MPAPAWFFTCAMGMIAIAILFPGDLRMPGWLWLVGLALMLGGVLLNFAAIASFARRETPMDAEREPVALVVDGPYAFTRNPMYVAGIVILCGLVLFLEEPRSALVLPLYVLLVARSFVPSDERRMAALFGDEWRAYTRRVRRWI